MNRQQTDREIITKLGQGIYTAADASRILKIPYPKAKYWFKNYARSRFNDSDFLYHFEVRDLTVVNFFALIEMYVFYTLKEKGITTSRILSAHNVMKDFLKTPYPFAKQDIYINNRSLLFGDEKRELITADKRLQTVIIRVLKPFVSKVQFNDDRLAHKYYPLGKEKTIVVNPENQFGQPVIEGTNILPETILNLSKGGESMTSIAKLYGINVKQVKHAIEFANAA